MSHLSSPALRHEHIVRINDPANAVGQWLTREQLWAGLLHTMQAPQELDESIDSATVHAISASTLQREIHRGLQVTADEVKLIQNELLQVRADAQSAFAGSTLTISIEEPAPQMLFVRFTYELYGLEATRDAQEDHARRSAYQNANIVRIRAARGLVQHQSLPLQ
jgi:acetylaranotin biosynthesis cluster protein L